MGREAQFSPSMAWVLEDLASSGVASATDCQIVNPQAMQKRSHPDRCWVSNEVSRDQCLLSTYQYLFPSDHKAFLCSAETWNPYNIYNGKWKVLALWLKRAPTGLCNYCCAALLAVCSVLRYAIPFTVSKADGSTATLPPSSKSYSSILVLKKSLQVIFILLVGISSLEEEIWNRLIYINYLITKKTFRRNVEILRFRNNKLDKCLSYRFLT